MKLNYSKKIFLLSLLIFIGILTLDIIFTNLLLGKIISINDKVRQLIISSDEREKELMLKDSILSTTIEREKFDQYFVGTGDGQTAEFITYLENLAKQNAVTQNISFVGYEAVTDLGASDTVSFVRFRLTVSGKWSAVFGYLQTIENFPKVVSVNAVTFNVNSESKIWSVDLDFSVGKLKN